MPESSDTSGPFPALTNEAVEIGSESSIDVVESEAVVGGVLWTSEEIVSFAVEHDEQASDSKSINEQIAKKRRFDIGSLRVKTLLNQIIQIQAQTHYLQAQTHYYEFVLVLVSYKIGMRAFK